MRREDHRVLALDRVDRDADRRDVRARHRNQRGDDAGRLRVLDDPLLGNLLDDAHALLPQGVAKNAEHLGAALRLGTAHAALVHAHLRELGRRRLVAARPGDRAAQPIDRRLVVGVDRRHRGLARARAARRAMACSSGVIVRAGAVATAMVTVRSGAAARRRTSTGILMRIGFSRVYSSSTSALRPATRPTMNSSLPTIGGKPEIDQDRRQRAVDVQRDRLDRARDRRFERPREADAVAGEPGVLGEPEQHGDARIDRRVHAMAESGQPPPAPSPRRPAARAAASSDSRRVRARSRPAAISSMQPDPAPPCSSPIVSTPAAMAADERLTVAGRREPRRRARRRAGAVVRRRRSGSRRSAGVRRRTAAGRDAAGRSGR